MIALWILPSLELGASSLWFLFSVIARLGRELNHHGLSLDHFLRPKLLVLVGLRVGVWLWLSFTGSSRLLWSMGIFSVRNGVRYNALSRLLAVDFRAFCLSCIKCDQLLRSGKGRVFLSQVVHTYCPCAVIGGRKRSFSDDNIGLANGRAGRELQIKNLDWVRLNTRLRVLLGELLHGMILQILHISTIASFRRLLFQAKVRSMLDKTVFSLRDKPMVVFCRNSCLIDRIDWFGAHSVQIVNDRGSRQLKLMLDQRLRLVALKARFRVNIIHVKPRVVLAMMLPFRELGGLVEARNESLVLRFIWVLQVLVVVDLHGRLRFGDPTWCAKVARILIRGFEDEHANGTFWIDQVLCFRVLPIQTALGSFYDRAAIVYGNGILSLESLEMLILVDVW